MKKDQHQLSHYSIFKYNKGKYTESEIVSGILNDSDIMIRYIYKSYYPGIKSMVDSFHNHSLDAEDIFQEGLTRAIINVRENRFNGMSMFSTYLSSICRNVCLKELKKSANYSDFDNLTITSDSSENHLDELIERMTDLKKKMDPACVQIIDLRFGLEDGDIVASSSIEPVESRKFEEIAKLLNIEVDNARQRFRRCFEKFKLVLQRDSEWKVMTN